MELNSYLQKFQPETKKQNKNSTLCAEIYEFYQKKIPYGKIAGLVRDYGYKHVMEQFLIAQKNNYRFGGLVNMITSIKIIKL